MQINQITPKYNVGDIIQLLNGKFRKIAWITVVIHQDYHTIEYTPTGIFQQSFYEQKIAQKIN